MSHLVCITGPELDETNRVLREACLKRGIGFVPVVAGRVSNSALAEAQGPRLLYRAATDRASELLEQLLSGPSATGFHDPLFPCAHAPLSLQRAGLPVPRQILFMAEESEARASQVARLGGFPVVLKRAGFEGGRGVFLIADAKALDAALDGVGRDVLVQAYVPHDRAFRLTVVGDQVVASTASRPSPDDFRSNAAGALDLGAVVAPPDAAGIAQRALAALGLEFGGVDLMETDTGACLLAEVNMPCYFVDQQRATGCDIAGQMIDYLAKKARAVGLDH